MEIVESVNNFAQPVAQPTYDTRYAPQNAPMQQSGYIRPMATFEPDDLIPEGDATDRKHRPRFVDFFMRKNSEENE